jgi:hypothetical protein
MIQHCALLLGSLSEEQLEWLSFFLTIIMERAFLHFSGASRLGLFIFNAIKTAALFPR